MISLRLHTLQDCHTNSGKIISVLKWNVLIAYSQITEKYWTQFFCTQLFD